MPKLPSTVAIGPVDYSVSEDDDALDDFRGTKGGNCWAFTDKKNTRMVFDSRLSEPRKRETLVHECIHALLYEWNVELGELGEEALVESLGNAVLDLIRSNPQLVAYVSAK